MAAPYRVEGKTALVTGAARGIGAGTAERLHTRGANVALVGLEPERLAELAERLGDRAAWFEADVTDRDAVERAVEATVERFGGIDVAVANAGISFVGTLGGAPIEHVERTLAVNLYGVLNTDRAVLPHVVERKGYLLNIASLAAAAHSPLMAPYAASKAAVEALSDCLRVETAPTGARIGCAYFGFIDTDLVRGGLSHPSSAFADKEMPGFIRKPVPLSRAVDVIERGIERRAARVWAPRYVGAALAVRGVLQPLAERRMMRSPDLTEALRLADAIAQDGEQDEVLGVAADALPERASRS